MPVLTPERTVNPRTVVAGDSGARAVTRPEFVLPITLRSATLLNLLLQDNAIDLGLASSVVALDPGLAFGVLQLANPMCAEPGDPIWQLPSALVAAGREALQNLLEYAPRLESQAESNGKKRVSAMMHDAVVRACLAHLLGRELGRCNPKKAYLGGMLFDIPEIVARALPAPVGYRARLLSIMCNSLPAALVRAAMADLDESSGVSDPVMAAILLAEAQLRKKDDLAESALWDCWPDLDREQRDCLLEHGAELAHWAGENLARLDPWEFMSRIERHG